jgi:hypothetical protein
VQSLRIPSQQFRYPTKERGKSFFQPLFIQSAGRYQGPDGDPIPVALDFNKNAIILAAGKMSLAIVDSQRDGLGRFDWPGEAT